MVNEAKRGQYRISNIIVSVARVGSQPSEVRTLRTPDDAARLFLATAPVGDEREHCRIAILDVRHNVKALHTVSIGTMTASIVHPREVFRPAILAGGVAILLTHNHPSGDPEPSGEDIAMTRRIAAAGTLLGIEVLDHIITGADGRFVSLKTRGVL